MINNFLMILQEMSF